MEDEEQKVEGELNIPPVTVDFFNSTREFLQITSQVPGDRWDDCVAECFHEEIEMKTRRIAADYLQEFFNMIHGYEVLLEEANKLTTWDAGLGGWLSYNQISMLISRQISRLATGRDGIRI